MNFLILHGTSSNSQGNWFPWLAAEIKKMGHKVWVPDLPDADRPNIQKYNKLLLGQNWDFNDSVVIGHSSGAVAILGLLPVLSKDTKINTAILVGAFTKRLSESPSWEMLRELFEESFDFEAIKKRADKFLFIHSEDDNICPIDQAEYLCEQTNGEMIRFKDKGHFTIRQNPKFSQFPEILEIIENKVLLQ